MLATLLKSRTLSETDRASLFEGLMRDTHRQAYNFAVRLTGNVVEAEDLVQETYLRAYRFFHRYDETQPFTSWVYRIMTNLHIDQLRRKGRIKTTSLESSGAEGVVWEVPDDNSAPDRHMVEAALDDTIQESLVLMNPEFRAAVLLADVEGLSYEEIADVMQCSVGTVRSRIHRGRKQLRTLLLRARYQPAGREAV